MNSSSSCSFDVVLPGRCTQLMMTFNAFISLMFLNYINMQLSFVFSHLPSIRLYQIKWHAASASSERRLKWQSIIRSDRWKEKVLQAQRRLAFIFNILIVFKRGPELQNCKRSISNLCEDVITNQNLVKDSKSHFDQLQRLWVETLHWAPWRNEWNISVLIRHYNSNTDNNSSLFFKCTILPHIWATCALFMLRVLCH